MTMSEEDWAEEEARARARVLEWLHVERTMRMALEHSRARVRLAIAAEHSPHEGFRRWGEIDELPSARAELAIAEQALITVTHEEAKAVEALHFTQDAHVAWRRDQRHSR
jgi:hypothetical protein